VRTEKQLKGKRKSPKHSRAFRGQKTFSAEDDEARMRPQTLSCSLPASSSLERVLRSSIVSKEAKIKSDSSFARENLIYGAINISEKG
jgi:hypothetical protein